MVSNSEPLTQIDRERPENVINWTMKVQNHRNINVRQ